MKWLKILILLIFNIAILFGQNDMTPQNSLDSLKAGNLRYMSGNQAHLNNDQVRRMQTSINGQKPIAAILSCSDSRVPVDLIFDTGIGDIFSVRVGGNICSTMELGSLEFSVTSLGTQLLVVLGHSKCGTISAVANNEPLSGSIKDIADIVKPVVAQTRKQYPNLPAQELISEAVKMNVYQSIEDIFTKSEIIRNQVKSGKLLVEAAIYDIETGKVEWLGIHPQQAKLLFKGGSIVKAKEDKDSLSSAKIQELQKYNNNFIMYFIILCALVSGLIIFVTLFITRKKKEVIAIPPKAEAELKAEEKDL